MYIPLQDGVYIRSIFLEGAGWDKKNSVLVEPAPMQLVCNMPVIYFRPTEHLKKRTKGSERTGEENRKAREMVERREREREREREDSLSCVKAWPSFLLH